MEQGIRSIAHAQFGKTQTYRCGSGPFDASADAFRYDHGAGLLGFRQDNEEFFARTLPEVRGSPDTALVPDLIAGGMAAVREAMAAALAAKEAASADVPTPSVKADSREGGAGHELVRG